MDLTSALGTVLTSVAGTPTPVQSRRTSRSERLRGLRQSAPGRTTDRHPRSIRHTDPLNHHVRAVTEDFFRVRFDYRSIHRLDGKIGRIRVDTEEPLRDRPLNRASNEDRTRLSGRLNRPFHPRSPSSASEPTHPRIHSHLLHAHPLSDLPRVTTSERRDLNRLAPVANRRCLPHESDPISWVVVVWSPERGTSTVEIDWPLGACSDLSAIVAPVVGTLLPVVIHLFGSTTISPERL